MRNQAAVQTVLTCEQYFDHIVLFPINVKPNTLVWDLYQEGSYPLVSRWDVVLVLARFGLKTLSKIHLTYYGNKGLPRNIKPLDCPVCHDDFEKFFDEFMMDYNGERRYLLVREMIKSHHCECKLTI